MRTRRLLNLFWNKSKLAVGSLLVVIGIPLFILPIPLGIVTIGAGLALVANAVPNWRQKLAFLKTKVPFLYRLLKPVLEKGDRCSPLP